MKRVVFFLFLLLAQNAFTQNQNLSNGIAFDGEPYIAINPNNSQHLVVAWMGFKLNNLIVIKTRTSTDAGQTWSPTIDIPHTVVGYQSADPSLAFDNNGNLFLCFIDYTPNPAAGAVYVAKSTDGGLSWGTPVEVINVNADGSQHPVDRPWMVVDNSGGPNDGNIYVTTMNPKAFGPVPPPYNPYFIKSTNNGASFEPWRYLDTANWLAGSLIPQPMPTPTVSADGTFHAIYPSYVLSQSLFAQYITASSTSAGNSFNYSVALQSANGSSDTLPKKGYLLIANPANANHLLCVYPNIDNGDIDIYMIESLNAGNSWSIPIRINDDPIANNRMQDLMWADFDTDGDVVITWRDRRNASDSTYKTSSEIWGAIRWKDSTSFSANFPITDSSISYNTILENNGNDFMCAKMINDTLYAVWGDTRNNFLNIWFQQIDLTTGVSSIKDLANDILPINIYPNPLKNITTINFGENDIKNAFIDVMDVQGKQLKHVVLTKKEMQVDFTDFPPGSYLIRFTNTMGSSAYTVIKE